MNDRVGGKTRMEYLLRELQDIDYFVEFETDEVNRVTHLFFVYDPAITVFRDNYDVVQLTCTY
ncbi:hypothetical protein V7S43_001751 [Phytophthora oleae]|uniref:Uncharacterized protein n=1 Tax=Phytophthora oleae TaxID=2107226 RepID=A0ABD3FZX0_9STRA